MRYLITFSCAGAHMHGDEAGSVDREHNMYGGRLADPNPRRLSAERDEMKHPPYTLDAARRDVVLQAICEVCVFRNWVLLAAHVRTNHVHVVVDAEGPPEKAMNAFKSYASRCVEPVGKGMRRIGNAGRGTAVHGGCGRMRRCGWRFGMLWMSRVRRWRCF